MYTHTFFTVTFDVSVEDLPSSARTPWRNEHRSLHVAYLDPDIPTSFASKSKHRLSDAWCEGPLGVEWHLA